ncbi:MAG: ankyrin repeat domain-containing protein [Acidithiobacillales bacterium]
MKKAALAFLFVLLSRPVLGDDALGTLTVRGKTTVLRDVAASEQTDPGDASVKWLVILASDRKVEGDRSPARLARLAAEGKLHGVRILWRVGSDTVRVAPYDAALPQSGRMAPERPTLDLKRYGSGRVDAEFQSKMLGQDWHFHAVVKAAYAEGGPVDFEPEAEAGKTPGQAAPGTSGGGEQAKKLALGKLGYEYTDEMFRHAVADGSPEAVRLFLDLGTSPNTQAKGEGHPMVLAASLCAGEGEKGNRSDVLLALVAAGGEVKAKDENGSTPLLWAVQTGCRADVIRALLKAGADPNATAKGGATPLMYAELFGRTEIAQILRTAGAKK